MNTLAHAPSPLLSEKFEDIELLRFPALSRFDGLSHAITTQPWNLAPHREVDRERSIERRRRLCHQLGMPFDRLTAPDQIHSHHVLRVLPSDVGSGRMGRETAVPFVDGLATDMPLTPLLQLSGDCALVLVYDPIRHAVGSAHASWRGTVAGIATVLVSVMAREFGCRAADLWAGISPCAGCERYEVGERVARIVRTMLPHADALLPSIDGVSHFDLKGANRAQLVQAGVPSEQVECAMDCTIGDKRFYSHRRDGSATGRFGLIAGLR